MSVTITDCQYTKVKARPSNSKENMNIKVVSSSKNSESKTKCWSLFCILLFIVLTIMGITISISYAITYGEIKAVRYEMMEMEFKTNEILTNMDLALLELQQFDIDTTEKLNQLVSELFQNINKNSEQISELESNLLDNINELSKSAELRALKIQSNLDNLKESFKLSDLQKIKFQESLIQTVKKIPSISNSQKIRSKLEHQLEEAKLALMMKHSVPPEIQHKSSSFYVKSNYFTIISFSILGRLFLL